MDTRELPIGVFDSGVGGLSVLAALEQLMPHENFLFYGDSAHAPYGERSVTEIIELADGVVEHLLSEGIKALVIACNTATSAAAQTLRVQYPHLPIIGIEPALKPAALNHEVSALLVMATEATLSLDKYLELAERFEDRKPVYTCACSGLAAAIEKGDLASETLKILLEDLIGEFRGRVDGVVLGCTHYSFVAPLVREILGEVRVFDGRHGCARHTKDLLERHDLLSQSVQPGTIVLQSSNVTADQIRIYEHFLQQARAL